MSTQAHHKSNVYAVILTFLACCYFVEKVTCQKFAENPGRALSLRNFNCAPSGLSLR